MLTNLHIAPFIRIYPSSGELRAMNDVDFTSNRLFFNKFSRKNRNFAAVLKFSSRFDGAYPNTNVNNPWENPLGGCVACCRGWDSAGLGIIQSHDQEPFYLTVDKTARLALIEPLSKIDSSPLPPSAVRSLRAVKREESHQVEVVRFFKIIQVFTSDVCRFSITSIDTETKVYA